MIRGTQHVGARPGGRNRLPVDAMRGSTAPRSTDPSPAATIAPTPSEAKRPERLWRMTPQERIAAFFRGELSFTDCQAWSRRFPPEPPTGPCGEYLYILVRTPEWLGEA